jgi:hypothetical protein
MFEPACHPVTEDAMKLACCLALAALLLPATVVAGMSDVDYCRALVRQYHTYVADMSSSHRSQTVPIETENAIDQCNAGNAAGIPVLERNLRDAKVDLPKRS